MYSGMIPILYQLYSEQIGGSGDFLLEDNQDFLLEDSQNFLLEGTN